MAQKGAKDIITLIIFAVVLFAGSIATAIIFVSLKDNTFNPVTSVFLRIILPIFGNILTAFFLVLAANINKKRKKQKELKNEYSDLIDTESSDNDKSFYPIDKPEMAEEYISGNPAVTPAFYKSSESIACSLCEKPIHKGQAIAICPKCNTIYHFEHLINWLQKNETCPNCGYDF
ncbi:MAG: hypothetical protein FK734_01210 [Asgard group archaeon]|nr:hypothetical protein [Asgard group archaeon]